MTNEHLKQLFCHQGERERADRLIGNGFVEDKKLVCHLSLSFIETGFLIYHLSCDPHITTAMEI
jgi:hypothetical protein